jgi:predicted transcriptional regulator
MKKHSGMRPQDIAVLLKITALGEHDWRMIDVATSLNLSASEVSESLNRSAIAGLIDESKKTVFKKSLLEFLVHGIKYVFPAQPNGVLKGMPTAHSAPPLVGLIVPSKESYVWPDVEGESNGQAIEPLYEGAVKAAKADAKLYELLSLVDALRVGKAREQNLAADELKNRIEGK